MSKYRIGFIVEDGKSIVFKPQVRKWFLWWDVGPYNPDIECAKLTIRKHKERSNDTR